MCLVGAGTVGVYIYHAKTRNAVEPAPSAATPAPAESSSPEPQSPQAEAAASGAAESTTTAPSSSVASTEAVPPPANPAPAAPKKPHANALAPKQVFFRYNGVDGHYGKVAYVDPRKPDAPVFVDTLSCEVVYVAGGSGLCLIAKRGIITTYSAKLFDATTFETRSQFAINGVPSRGRVSRDGRIAAFTVFVAGHGYTSLDFSTQTLLVDTTTGTTIADLETFAITRDGKPFKEADFNFWGVTFTPDTKAFYATLSSGGQHYLIRGDIESRTAKVIHSNVECPSLSPDGTRVAYKKRFVVDGRILWELHVVDLATDKEISLQEKRSVDDQLEWLDANTVLYSVPETENDTSPSTDVWMTAADGKSGDPKIFLHRAFSPAAVR